jgi:hypothetical protein
MPVKILYHTPVSNFNSDWLTPIVNQYFEFEFRDEYKTYAPGTLYYINWLEFNNPTSLAMIDRLLQEGFRIIIDNLWEINPGYEFPAHVIAYDRWFWYNESIWYRRTGYDRYVPIKDIKYTALMPMNRKKPHRDDFIKRINTDNLLWSYCDEGTRLPDDDVRTPDCTQRYFNSQWYNETYASMVVESEVYVGSKHTPIFITEKTMKPMAFQHPLIVYGNYGTLKTLRDWGFETFDNLWDESYDQIVDTEQRRDAIIKLLNQLPTMSMDYDTETLQRIQHNHNHFYDQSLAIDGIIKNIIEPILHYAET